MFGLGVLVFLMRPLGIHPGPIGLGIILGPIIEPALVQSLYISHASSIGNVFFTGAINITLIAITVLSIALVVMTRLKDRTRERAGGAIEPEPIEAE
jgi:putative tricarboxylic transport membrane protein